MARMAHWGGLMTASNSSTPYMPRFEMLKEPPMISSILSSLQAARAASSFTSAEISQIDLSCALRTMGVASPPSAVEGGLATPIVRKAQLKSIWEIAAEVKELAARAARNELKMDEIMGGSFSISNLGMYGVDEFDAVINPPQCAILAIGAARPRCVVSRDLEPLVAMVMRVTLSADHRAIDGVAGARFLSALKSCIEAPPQIGAAYQGEQCNA